MKNNKRQDKKMKENLIASFHISNQPLSNDGEKVVLFSEIFKIDSVNETFDAKICMDIDMYLDLISAKNTYKGDDHIYFSSNIVKDFNIIKEISEMNDDYCVEITEGVLAAYNETEEIFETIKVIEE